ncbi:MAG: xanthine dehydrogenase family protein subunit M, partial [Deltaproteobacteria bacterium]|nr:xanthine dehydrogenase family protein subunit M [Deltaproteobacteria bacterium]
EAKPIAGGTGLINLMKQQLVQAADLIGLRRLTGLNHIVSLILPPDQGQARWGSSDAGGLALGSLCTLHMLETSPLIMQHAPLLAEASRQVATIRIRSMATVGGALAHADPNGDLPPAMIALDARVRLRSCRSTREIPAAEFFTGYYETMIEPDELVIEITIPPQPPDTGISYIKFLPQTRDDYATVAVAARVSLQADRISDVRVALGAVGATPIRATKLEDELCGRVPAPAVLKHAAELVADIVDPVSDFRGSASYKREMAVVFTRRALAQAAAMAQGGGAA